METTLHFQVAGEAHLRRPIRIDDGVARAAGLCVQASRAVAAFATDVLRVRPVRHKSGVAGGGKVFIDLCMTFRAALRTNKLRAGNIRRSDHESIHCHAGDQASHGEQRQHDPSDLSAMRVWS